MQARIGAQSGEQRSGLGQTRRQPRHLPGREKKQAVALEKGATLRLADAADHVLACRQRRHQLGCRFGDALGRRAIHDDDDIGLRECVHVLEGTLGPGQVGRKQRGGVGRHREMPHGIGAAEHRQDRRRQDNPPGVTGAKIDDAENQGAEHLVARCRLSLPLPKRAATAGEPSPVLVSYRQPWDRCFCSPRILPNQARRVEPT